MNKALIKEVSGTDQDFEWYPTTNEILEVVKEDIEKTKEENHSWYKNISLLDCGAGDGRVLNFLKESFKGGLYAIEKSIPLINVLDKDISIVGTEFHEQTLIDKKVDIIFCNPPYSEYVSWFCKIAKEGNCAVSYLVVPSRWVDNPEIQEVLKNRKINTEVIGSFDFLEGDRAARAKVDVIRCQYPGFCVGDPFNLWFDEFFPEPEEKEDEEGENNSSARLKKELSGSNDLVKTLESLYQRDLNHLMENYKSIRGLDRCLLSELGVSRDGLIRSLKEKISGLKLLYWRELFSHLTEITERLITSKTDDMLKKLMSNVSVDFTRRNAYAIVCWAVRHANEYFDDQIIEVVEKMVDSCNISMYKSNEKVIGKEYWNYRNNIINNDNKYKLENRIIYSGWRSAVANDWGCHGLSENARNTIKDFTTIANCLGYICDPSPLWENEWSSGKRVDFYCIDKRTGKEVILMAVKCFQAGTIHFKFHPMFVCDLNVQFGKLKGWVKSKQEAKEEMDLTDEQVEAFESHMQLSVDDNLMLPRI